MKALTLLIATLLAVALVGCGKEEAQQPAAPAAPEPTSWWDGFFGKDEPEPPVIVETEPTSWWDGLFGGEPEPAPVAEPTTWWDRMFGNDEVATTQ